jgi:RNA polymerase sigma-70 factor (ECF subfamily)
MPDQEIRALLTRRRWEQAFELLVAEYQGKVFRLAYSILGHRAQAEDAAQDALLRVWRAIETYDGRAAISTWLYAITRNTALSLREYHARRVMTPLEAIAEPAANPAAEPEQELWDLVADLPDPYRQVIVLYHMEEKSYDEVACMLGIPVGTVKTHLHRARKLLGARMEEQV